MSAATGNDPRRMPRTKDGTRRIITTPSQTFMAKLTRAELLYLEWLEERDRLDRIEAKLDALVELAGEAER